MMTVVQTQLKHNQENKDDTRIYNGSAFIRLTPMSYTQQAFY